MTNNIVPYNCFILNKWVKLAGVNLGISACNSCITKLKNALSRSVGHLEKVLKCTDESALVSKMFLLKYYQNMNQDGLHLKSSTPRDESIPAVKNGRFTR